MSSAVAFNSTESNDASSSTTLSSGDTIVLLASLLATISLITGCIIYLATIFPRKRSSTADLDLEAIASAAGSKKSASKGLERIDTILRELYGAGILPTHPRGSRSNDVNAVVEDDVDVKDDDQVASTMTCSLNDEVEVTGTLVADTSQ